MIFNADLYTVAATVIPVLFVAMMLPSGILARYSLWTKQLRSRQLQRVRKSIAARGEDPDKVPAPRLTALFRSHDLVRLPVTLFFVLFLGGEISAVLAIDHRHATAVEHWWVMASLVVLPILSLVSAVAATSFEWARDIPHSAEDGPSDSGGSAR
jgi:hypothetical protein